MSEISTLDKLEPFLAQVAAGGQTTPPAQVVSSVAPPANSYQGSQLELFFSEVRYSTFVARKKPTARLSESSAGSQGVTLKYSPRLH